MRDIFDTLSHEASVRAIVFSGAGDKAFSAGLDIQRASATDSILNPEKGTKVRAFEEQIKLARPSGCPFAIIK